MNRSEAIGAKKSLARVVWPQGVFTVMDVFFHRGSWMVLLTLGVKGQIGRTFTIENRFDSKMKEYLYDQGESLVRGTRRRHGKPKEAVAGDWLADSRRSIERMADADPDVKSVAQAIPGFIEGVSIPNPCVLLCANDFLQLEWRRNAATLKIRVFGSRYRYDRVGSGVIHCKLGFIFSGSDGVEVSEEMLTDFRKIGPMVQAARRYVSMIYPDSFFTLADMESLCDISPSCEGTK